MEELIQKFQASHPHALLVNTKAEVRKLPDTKLRGSHQANPEELKKYGVRKRQLIVDLIADWVALYSSTSAIGREESTYFMMARMLHDSVKPEYRDRILGWKMVEGEKLLWHQVDRDCVSRSVEEQPAATDGKLFTRITDHKLMPTPINETAVLPNRLQEEASKTTGGHVPAPQGVC
jgi:hypothetical protein